MESKRHSMAGRIATPKAATPTQGAGDLEGTLSKAIGGRVRITTSGSSQTVEGTLFTACPITNLVAINAASAPPNPASGEYHIIPISQIQNVQVLSPSPTESDNATGSPYAAFDAVLPNLSKSDMDSLKAREDVAIRKMKEFDATRGKGVTKEAQEIFDWFARTLPTRWNGQQIVVNDSVLVSPPYTIDDCKAAKDKQLAETQIKKVLEGYYSRKKPQPSNNNSNRPVPATPFVPRKGG